MKNALKSSSVSCTSCMRCSLQDINGNILCREKGITTYNYYCHRYKPKPATSSPSKSLRHTFITCTKCKYYDQNNSKISGMGTCVFYKLRPFPGSQRKACSNFLMSEISSELPSPVLF